MLLSYAVGYALSTDFPGSNMKDLFRYADKNMYVDKNRAKMKEAADKRRIRSRLLQSVKKKDFILQIVCTVMRLWISMLFFVQAQNFSLQMMVVILVQ